MNYLYAINFFLDTEFNEETIEKILFKASEKNCKFINNSSKQCILDNALTYFSIDEAKKRILNQLDSIKKDDDPTNCLLIQFLNSFFCVCFYKDSNNKTKIIIQSSANSINISYCHDDIQKDLDFYTYTTLGLMICDDFPISKVQTKIFQWE